MREIEPTVTSRSRTSRQWRLRFRLLDLMWLALLTAVLILWYKDHQSLSNQLASVNTRHGWSVRQLLGRPDTPTAGDRSTAWASLHQDSGTEWVIVEFTRSVAAIGLQVEETYNPGAVNRVCSVDFRGGETEVWKGKDPTAVGSGKGSSIITFANPISSRRFKIYLDSRGLAGWNEIDALGLHGKDGSIQWASDAWASSSYGANQEPPALYWP